MHANTQPLYIKPICFYVCSMQQFYGKKLKKSDCTVQNLNKLAELVRGEMPKLSRRVIGALITIDVHARDIVTQMVTNEVCIRITQLCRSLYRI